MSTLFNALDLPLAITHISKGVSLVNLQLAAEGNQEVLQSQPKLRTGTRKFGIELMKQAAISLTTCTSLVLFGNTEESSAKYEVTVADVEEMVEKVNNAIIAFTLTQRTEEQLVNKEAFQVFRSAINWSSMVSNLAPVYGKGDKQLDNAVKAIRLAANKLFTEEKVSKVFEVFNTLGLHRELEYFESSLKNCSRIIDLKGSMESCGISIYANSVGLQVGINNNRNKLLVTSDWFTPEMYAKVRRVRITNWNLDSSYVQKVAFILHSKVCLDGMSRDDIYMSLTFNSDLNKLVPEKCPTLKFNDSLVSKTGFIEPSKFKDGMFTYYPTNPVQYVGIAEQANGVFNSFVDAKKFAARQEKLNKYREDGYYITLNNVVFLKDAPEGMNDRFNTGCLYLSEQDLLKLGVCRMTSNIQNGMLKGATSLATLIDPVKGKDHTYLCSSSYKGGLVGIMNILGCSYNLEQEISVPDNIWEEITVDGVKTLAVTASIQVCITNPYTLHSYTLSKTELDEDLDIGELDIESVEKLTEEYEAEYKEGGSETPLAFEMLESALDRDLTIAQVIEEYKQYGLRSKKPLTSIVSSDLESVRNAYGKEEAEKMIKSLLVSNLNKASKKRRYAFDIINNQFDVVNTISMFDIVSKFQKLKELYSVAGTEFNSCNRNFLLLFVEALGANRTGRGWVKIEHEGQSVHLPIGNALYGDLMTTSHTLDKVVVTGILPAVLKEMNNLLNIAIKIKGDLPESIVNAFFSSLELEVQWSFINKDLGRMKTKGKYFVALPGHWLKNKHDVCLPGRDKYVPKKTKQKSVKGNIGKQPIIFHGSFCGCRVFKDLPFAISEELRQVLSCVVFVHPEYLLELQNDADGDLIRISFDSHILPFYDSKVLEQEAKNFFSAYIEKEKDFVVGNTQKMKKWSAKDLQISIADAVISKERVGSYTDRMHIIATHIDTLVPQLGEEQRRMIVRFYGILIQECAMNAIKHNSNGNGLTVADALAKNKLAEVDKKTDKMIGIGRAIKMVREFLDLNQFEFEGMNTDSAARLIVATTKVINEGYGENACEMHRRLFKERPKAGGEYIKFLGTNLEESSDSTYSVLYTELKNSLTAE